MDRMRRHEINLALRTGGDGSELDLGVARAAAIVEAVVALETLGAVEHAVEYPGVSMVVHAAGTAGHAHHRVDHEVMLGIDVEQQVLVAFGRWPVGRMRLQARLHHEPFERKPRALHAAAVLALGRPDRPQLADELVQDRKSRRHIVSYS